jgi:hypothetical protein
MQIEWSKGEVLKLAGVGTDEHSCILTLLSSLLC